MENKEIIEKIRFNVVQGRLEKEDEGYDEGLEGQPAVKELIEEAIQSKVDPKSIITVGLSVGMEEVGERYEKGEYLIPDMLASAEAVGMAMDILAPHLSAADVHGKGKFLIATVEGDLHDIGKNIVAIMLKGAGYEVIDLGTGVATERIVDIVKEDPPDFLGLSALLTTTMDEMRKVIERMQEENLDSRVKVFIGGAPTSEDFAKRIGAYAYCRDAFHALDILKKLEG
jgi:5-methyltetrahydrofolate--homocysteine methyltransferase